MATCFVIQPFDRGAFDKRYTDVFEPAIRAAGLDPYRVDRDPSASVPIEKIESGIRDAKVCLADITTDNPNVWFEVGFAFASAKEVALICAASRERFPFDIQHRHVIRYDTESTSDFDALRERITKRLRAISEKAEKLEAAKEVSSVLAPVQGLASHEIVALVAVAQNLEVPMGSASAYIVRQDMQKAGFTPVAFTLAMAALAKQQFVDWTTDVDPRDGEQFVVYKLTDAGLDWLNANQDKLALEAPPPRDAPF